MMKIITFFNNKGGVGKTTLVTNIASYLQINYNKRILLIDADPQSNSTQMILSEAYWEKVYSNDSTETTLYSFLQPITYGDSSIDPNHNPFPGEENRFNVDLIPGHPRISLLEDKMSHSWNLCNAGDIGGFRVTNWMNSLRKSVYGRYDYILVDVGPSLGALNRSILLNSDAFITPMGCDIFSLIGIENISNWMTSWGRTYKSALNVLKEKHPNEYIRFDINTNVDRNFRFIGYSVQQYITKVIGGQRRGIASYDKIRDQIPFYINNHLKDFIDGNIAMKDCALGDIPHLWSLVPLAQTNNSPIHQLESSDGLIGSQYKIKKNYDIVLNNLCSKIIENLEGISNE